MGNPETFLHPSGIVPVQHMSLSIGSDSVVYVAWFDCSGSRADVSEDLRTFTAKVVRDVFWGGAGTGGGVDRGARMRGDFHVVRDGETAHRHVVGRAYVGAKSVQGAGGQPRNTQTTRNGQSRKGAKTDGLITETPRHAGGYGLRTCRSTRMGY